MAASELVRYMRHDLEKEDFKSLYNVPLFNCYSREKCENCAVQVHPVW